MIHIIIPAYNAQKYISNAVKSVIRQSYQDWNLIIVDDGSTDKTPEICEKLSSKDQRIHVIHQENQGSCQARISALKYLENKFESYKTKSAEYVAFLDADDMYYDKDSINKLVSAAKNSSADIVCAEHKKFFGKTIRVGIPINVNQNKLGLYEKEDILNKLYISFFGVSYIGVDVWAKLYRFSIMKKVLTYKKHPDFFADDLFTNAIVFPLAERITVIPDIVYYYRYGGGTSRFMPSFLNDALFMYDFKKEMMEKYPMPQDALLYTECELKNLVRDWLIMCLTKGGYSDKEMMEEIDRCAKLPQVQEILSNPQVAALNKNTSAFVLALKDCKYETVFNILKKDASQKNRFSKNLLKKVKKYFK